MLTIVYIILTTYLVLLVRPDWAKKSVLAGLFRKLSQSVVVVKAVSKSSKASVSARRDVFGHKISSLDIFEN